MSNTISNGRTIDLNVQVGESLKLTTIAGAYTATVVSGVGAGTVLATDSSGGATYGPYSGAALIRLKCGATGLIDFAVGTSPVLDYAPVARFGVNAAGDAVSMLDWGGVSYSIAEERVDVVNRRAVFDGGAIPDNRKRASVHTKAVTNSENSDYIESTQGRRIVISLDSNTATSTITATGGQSIALFAAAAAAGFRWDEPNRPFRYISVGAQASGAVVTVKEVA
jgi:hypothetical protein